MNYLPFYSFHQVYDMMKTNDLLITDIKTVILESTSEKRILVDNINFLSFINNFKDKIIIFET
jgi:hypothetical protein